MKKDNSVVDEKTFINADGIMFRSISLLFRSAPVLASLTFLLVALASVFPSVMAIISADIVNKAVASGFTASLYKNVFVWIALLFLSNILSLVNENLTETLGDRVVDKINTDLIAKAATLKDLYNFENPAFHSAVHLLRTSASTRPLNLVSNIMLNVKNVVILISMLYVLFTVHFAIPFFLVACIVPNVIVTYRMNGKSWIVKKQNDIHDRKADYFVQMMLDTSLLKDTIHLALGSFAEKNYRNIHSIVLKENLKVRKQKILYTLPTLLLSTLGNIAIFAFTIHQISIGKANIGTLVLFLQSFFQVQIYLSDLVVFGGYLRTILLYFQTFFDFMEWKNTISLGSIAQISIENCKKTNFIEFKNVSFSYPNSSKKTLDNLNFTIEEGETVAFVGANGEGKSTVIKLLLRFYEVDEGEILYKGENISSIKIDEWRKIIACVFQDFAKYMLCVYDNVTLPLLSESENEEKIKDTLSTVDFPLEKGNASLGKEFGGCDLSGGQWQKLAIARALYRKDSKILILDEPTAAIDPLAEAELFREFQTLSKGKTVFMVTHRLASAVDADKIIVLSGGTVAEIGQHAELMAKNGLYRTMFDTQAEKYRA